MFYLTLPVTESLEGETTQPVRAKLWARLQQLTRGYVMPPVVLGPTSAGLYPMKTCWHWYFSLRNWKVTHRARSGCWLGAAELKGLSHAQPPGTSLVLVHRGGSPGAVPNAGFFLSKVWCTAHYSNFSGRWWGPEYLLRTELLNMWLWGLFTSQCFCKQKQEKCFQNDNSKNLTAICKSDRNTKSISSPLWLRGSLTHGKQPDHTDKGTREIITFKEAHLKKRTLPMFKCA